MHTIILYIFISRVRKLNVPKQQMTGNSCVLCAGFHDFYLLITHWLDQIVSTEHCLVKFILFRMGQFQYLSITFTVMGDLNDFLLTRNLEF